MLFYLMHKNTKVALINVVIGHNYFSVNNVKQIFNNKLMPLITKNKKYRETFDLCSDITRWYYSRFFDLDRKNFYPITNQISMNYNNRSTDIMYPASIYTYGASLLDNYWLNPFGQISFEINEYMPKLELEPTTWEKVDFHRRKWSSDIGKIMKTSVFDTESLRVMRYPNLDSPDLALPGRFAKRWIEKDNELYIEKIFPNTPEGIELCERQIKMSEFIKEINPELCIEYTKDDEHPNICYCKNFLKKNEEYISPYAVLMFNTGNTEGMSGIEIIQRNAIKLGCSKKKIKEYNKAVALVNEHFGFKAKDENNLGFIVDSRTNKIIKPAPLFGCK